MDFWLILLGGAGAIAFIMVGLSRRSSGFRGAINRLENEVSALEARRNSMQEDFETLKGNIAELKGNVQQYEETQAQKEQAAKDAAKAHEIQQKETFMEFLLRTSVLTKETISKAKAYKEKSQSDQSLIEIMVVHGYVDSAALTKAKQEYDEARLKSGDAS